MQSLFLAALALSATMASAIPSPTSTSLAPFGTPRIPVPGTCGPATANGIYISACQPYMLCEGGFKCHATAQTSCGGLDGEELLLCNACPSDTVCKWKTGRTQLN